MLDLPSIPALRSPKSVINVLECEHNLFQASNNKSNAVAVSEIINCTELQCLKVTPGTVNKLISSSK